MAAMGSRTAGARGAVGRRAAGVADPLTRCNHKIHGQRLVDVRFAAHYGLNSEIAPGPKSANSDILIIDASWEISSFEILSLSDRTVEWHVQRSIAKLGARTRTNAVVIALREGIIAF
jgi:hypothetical protein